MNQATVSSPQNLEVILKTVERCNLNCTYCYFFNGSDSSYTRHPPCIRKETLIDVCHFLKQAALDFPLKRIVIDLHGGEPTLQKKESFCEMCELFKESLASDNCALQIKIQTNGTLLDDEWIELFSRFKVGVGVSLDGPEEENRERIDHRHRSSYPDVRRGISLVEKGCNAGLIPYWGILCVINPNFSAKKIYRHFVDELGATGMDFLLPDYTHEGFAIQSNTPEEYGQFLCDLLDEWALDDNPQILVRILYSVLKVFLGGTHLMGGLIRDNPKSIVLTISSNGDLSGDDSWRTAVPDLMHLANVKNTSLAEFLEIPSLKNIGKEIANLPSECNSCCWSRVCNGGFATNRYSKKNGFSNRSVYCSGLLVFYKKCAEYLINNGIDSNDLKQFLVATP